PAAATKVTLALGLEQTTGKAWFDDVSVRVVARRRPATAHAGPVFKGHNHTRLRGAMIGPRLTEEDLRVLGGKWKANHVRWQLIWGGFPHGPGDKATVAEYEQWLDGQMDRLARFLPVCRELGVLVLIDMHTPPGGRDEENRCRMFAEAEFQQAFVRSWDRIARRFRNEKIVWGYDLVNEPVEGAVADGLMDWQALAEHTAKRVRAIDAEHAIIVEPAPWGSPGSLAHFDPLDVPGVVYSVHMYQPHHFTHQGVRDTPFGPTYPGVIDGKHWDKEQLREALRPAIEFQRDYGVHIYIGEFSAIRWAPNDSAYRYLRDVIELCEEYEWDWAYHAFREFDGWSVEHGADPKNRRPVTTPTTRERLLRSWFEKNQRAQAQFPIDRNADASRLVAVPRSRSLLSGRR
ncbi:MAG: glycoside hydrolase family 5 protein, partial [Planctomycetota bacterium]